MIDNNWCAVIGTLSVIGITLVLVAMVNTLNKFKKRGKEE